MKQRILTGIGMFAVIALVLFLSEYVLPIVYDAFVLLLMVISAFEICKAISKKYGRPIYAILFLYIFLGYMLFKITHSYFGRAGITSFFSILGFLIIVALIYNMFSERQTLSNIISTVFCMVYPLSIMVYMLALNYLGVGTESAKGLIFTDWTFDPMATGVFIPNYRAIAVISVLICSSFTDIFALIVGMKFKGPKLAPHISPKKTISGGIGGIFGGLLGAGVVLGLGYTGVIMGLTPLSDVVWKNILLYMGMGFGIAFFTEIGDLIASYIKRYCEIKDYGTLFPGHGGMLDRIDGIILSSVFTYAYFTVILMFSGLA